MSWQVAPDMKTGAEEPSRRGKSLSSPSRHPEDVQCPCAPPPTQTVAVGRRAYYPLRNVPRLGSVFLELVQLAALYLSGPAD